MLRKRILWVLLVVVAIYLLFFLPDRSGPAPLLYSFVAAVFFFLFFPRDKAAALKKLDPTLRFRWLRNWLRRYGVPADVTVTAIQQTEENIDGVPVSRITAHLDSGEIIEFEDCFELVKAPTPGDRIHVNIDPNDHTKVIVA